MTVTDGERRSVAGDLATGIVLFAIAALCAWSLATNRILLSGQYGNDPGPLLLPALLIGLLGACATGMIAVSGIKLARLSERSGPRPPVTSWRSLFIPALLIVTMIAYAQSMTSLGFLETTMVFALFWTVVIGIQDSGRPDMARLAIWLAEGVAICAAVYAVFAWLIQIPLP